MAASYVRLRGIPFSASDQELAQWFQTAPGGPITVIRVHFTFNALGRKSGEAYVELPENMAARERQQGISGPRNSNISRTNRLTARRLMSTAQAVDLTGLSDRTRVRSSP